MKYIYNLACTMNAARSKNIVLTSSDGICKGNKMNSIVYHDLWPQNNYILEFSTIAFSMILIFRIFKISWGLWIIYYCEMHQFFIWFLSILSSTKFLSGLASCNPSQEQFSQVLVDYSFIFPVSSIFFSPLLLWWINTSSLFNLMLQ